jgi:hypothetical protein
MRRGRLRAKGFGHPSHKPAEVALGPRMECIDFSRCSNLDSKMVGWCLRLVSGQGHGVVFVLAAATGLKKAAVVKEQKSL